MSLGTSTFIPMPFPPELFEVIISQAWHSHMSNADRITFMTSSMLVSRFWQRTYQLVSRKHIHVPSRSYLSYLDVISITPNAVCETISLRVEGRSSASPSAKMHQTPKQQQQSPPYPIYDDTEYSTTKEISYDEPADDWLVPACKKNDLPMGQALTSLLYDLSWDNLLLPNLRAIYIHYVDIPNGQSDVFEQYRLVDFPSRVKTLSISFANTEEDFVSRAGLFVLSAVENLSVTGACGGFVADMKGVCPKLKNLVVDGMVQKL